MFWIIDKTKTKSVNVLITILPGYLLFSSGLPIPVSAKSVPFSSVECGPEWDLGQKAPLPLVKVQSSYPTATENIGETACLPTGPQL